MCTLPKHISHHGAIFQNDRLNLGRYRATSGIQVTDWFHKLCREWHDSELTKTIEINLSVIIIIIRIVFF